MLRIFLTTLSLLLLAVRVDAATYVHSPEPFAWIDPTSHTDVVWTAAPGGPRNECQGASAPVDDDITQAIPLGFTFPFGGTTYTSVRIMSNGRLQFNNRYCGYGTQQVGPPRTYPYNYPDNRVVRTMRVYGADIDPRVRGRVTYASLGTAPNRYFVVTWSNVSEWSAPGSNFNLQVILREQGDFIYQYGPSNNPTQGHAQIGWELTTSDFDLVTYTDIGSLANTAIRFHLAPPPTPVAYYMMDEAGWNGTAGEVRDSSGNNRNGTAVGTANTNNTRPAIPGNPGTCGYGEIPDNRSTATRDAVDTGIDLNNVGDRGTISFWYKSNLNWRTNVDRQLLDASDDRLGAGNPNNKYFFLVLRNRGRLRFALEDSNDRDLRVETNRLGYRAGDWVYITVTWDLPANRMAIYVNGTLNRSQSITSNGRLGNVATLYAGDNRSSYLVAGATRNSANGSIDELRLYDTVLSPAQIRSDMNATHPCGGLNHLRIEHDGTALTCQPEAVTVRACADPACATLYTDPVSVTLTPAGWVGGATQTLSGGVATFRLRHTVPGTVTLGISSSTPSPTAATECLNTATSGASCNLTFYDSGFVYSIPTQTACSVSAPVTVAAVRKDVTTQRCVPAFANRTADVNFWTTYVDPATGTRQLTLNNGSTDYLLSTAAPGSAVPLTFDANGEAIVTVRYPDAGRLSLNSRFTGTGTESGLVMTGSADFVTKPARFVVQSPDLNADCASGDATCSVFRAAGDTFNLTVRAACADGSVTPNFVHDNITIGHNLVAPAGGSAGAIGVTSTAITAADNGETTITNQSVSEVGVFSFTAQLGTPWLGETVIGNAASNTSPNIGRFIPAWFDVSRVNGCDAGNFTYSGQPFVVTATAYNSAGAITSNYAGSLGFAFDTSLSNAGDTTNFTNNVIPAGNFGAGIGTRADVTYTFPVPETAPATLALRATDTDGISSAGHLEPATDIHSGRVRLANAFGSELLDLQVPMHVQHYDGTAFVDFPSDTCTTTTVNLTRIDGTLSVGTGANPGETCIRDDAGNSGSNNCSDASQIPGPVAEQFAEPPVNASFNLWLKAPGQNFTGNVDVNATVDTWLRFDWNGDGTPDDPAARATFGIYRGDDRIIYWRERFD